MSPTRGLRRTEQEHQFSVLAERSQFAGCCSMRRRTLQVRTRLRARQLVQFWQNEPNLPVSMSAGCFCPNEANFDRSWPGWFRSARSSKGASVARLSSAADFGRTNPIFVQHNNRGSLQRVSFLPERTQFFQRPFSSDWTVRAELWKAVRPPSGDLCADAFLMTLEAREIRLFPARSFLRSSDEYRSRQSLAWVNED